MRLAAAFVAVGGVCVLSAQTPAQSPTPDRQLPIFRAGVDVVQLEVSIFDADRRVVHGLKKEDLQVFEDGKLQDIVDLREIVLDDGEPPPVWTRAVSPDVTTNDLGDRRLIGIVLDDLRCCGMAATGMTDRMAVSDMKATADYLVSSLGPHDLATVVLTHELAALQPFTGDRDALRATIGRFTPTTDSGCFPKPPLPNLTADLVQLLAMSSLPMKAVVVIQSPSGIGAGLPPCQQRSYVVPDLGRRVPVTVRPDDGPEPDPLSLPPVPVYHLMAGRSFAPLFAPRDPPTAERDEYVSDDGPGTVVDRILDQNASYYLLGFHTSRPTTDGKYRRIEVKIPGHRNYTVRSRAGYMRPKPAPAPGSRAERNPEVPRPPGTVSSLLPHSDITMQTAVAAFALPDGRKNALVIAVDLGHAVLQDSATGAEELDLRTVVYASGDPKYDVATKARLTLPSGVNRVSGSAPARLDVDPDRYELWLTAHDARTSRVGSVVYDLEIPDRAANAVTISGVVLGREPTEFEPVPAVYGGIVPIVPVTSRSFGQGEFITAFFQIYQGLATPLAPAALTIRVLDSRGVVTFTADEILAPDRFSRARAADYRLTMPFRTLSAGQYLLTIEARVGQRISPRRDVMFSVR